MATGLAPNPKLGECAYQHNGPAMATYKISALGRDKEVVDELEVCAKHVSRYLDHILSEGQVILLRVERKR